MTATMAILAGFHAVEEERLAKVLRLMGSQRLAWIAAR